MHQVRVNIRNVLRKSILRHCLEVVCTSGKNEYRTNFSKVCFACGARVNDSIYNWVFSNNWVCLVVNVLGWTIRSECIRHSIKTEYGGGTSKLEKEYFDHDPDEVAHVYNTILLLQYLKTFCGFVKLWYN